MQLNKLGIGVPLSKEEQKEIKGGNPCPTPETVECFCVDGNFDTGESPINPYTYCKNLCSAYGGYVSYECV